MTDFDFSGFDFSGLSEEDIAFFKDIIKFIASKPTNFEFNYSGLSEENAALLKSMVGNVRRLNSEEEIAANYFTLLEWHEDSHKSKHSDHCPFCKSGTGFGFLEKITNEFTTAQELHDNYHNSRPDGKCYFCRNVTRKTE